MAGESKEQEQEITRELMRDAGCRRRGNATSRYSGV